MKLSELTVPQVYSTVGFIVMMAILAAFAWILLTKLRRMDLSNLVCEPPPAGVTGPGKASLSRFQFLLFTFLIAGLFVVLSLESCTLIEIPNGVVGLMGVSGLSYMVAKAVPSGGAGGAGGTTTMGGTTTGGTTTGGTTTGGTTS